jgi:hypothetical protein
MPARTNCSPPNILCTCGETRAYPVAIGLPPIGTESLCLSCNRLWRLDEYIPCTWRHGEVRWAWSSEDLPKTDIKAANALARTLMGIDAALAELGLFHGAARGEA